MFYHQSSKRSRSRGTKSNRNATSLRGLNRRAIFEPLESRNLLSVTLPVISNQTVTAGAPLHLPLVSTGTTNPVSYTVSVDNANVAAAVPTGNTYLKLHVTGTDKNGGAVAGDMVFQLFNDLAPKTVANLTSLINQTPNFYNGLTFHRIIANFMMQGGDPDGDGTGGPGYQIDDEFNANLQFTSSGILAMANSGPDTNGSQFFITDAPYRTPTNGDFKYSIFGFLVEGDSIRQTLTDNVATDSSDKPTHPVTITSAQIVTAPLDGVLRISAPASATSGSSVVTVTATDSVTHETSVQHFTATIAADTVNDPPFLGTINPITTPVNTPIIYQIPATDVEGDSIYYDAIVSPANANLTVSVNHSTGQLTVTPSASLAAGVYSIEVGVASSSSGTYDTQFVAVYVTPAAPTGIQLLAASDTGSSSTDGVTNLNNTSGKTLQYQVNGVVSGAIVKLYADGTLVGSATASSTSVTITTNGAVTLNDGTHAITATQTLAGRAVHVGNLDTTADLVSNSSAALSTVVDTTSPQFSFTPVTTASIGIAYNCQAAITGDMAGTVAYSLINNPPSGMTVNASTGLITWTPATGQTSPANVTLQVSDRAGNTNQTSYAIQLVAPNSAPVLVAASPSLGTISEDAAPQLITVASFVNGGSGTTQITDADTGNALGGIAVSSFTGNGTWEYTLDGTTFHTIVSVSSSSALLLPHTASLRYTPDARNGETATIIYRAWDETSGIAGSRMDVSQSVLVGGNTAFSTLTDTATLTVTSLNDAPVVTPVAPSMGSADIHSATTINLTGTFINNGTGKTSITDVDTGAVLGGIAIYGTTGAGTWAYSLDGSTFTAIGAVSNASALLLPKTAQLRYTPDGSTSESPTIAFRAWDTTTGTPGTKVDLSASGATGGTTAFSATPDTATLTVTDVNDAPVLTAGSPSLGSTTEDAARTITVASIINNGSGTTTITDPDTNAIIGGIAVIGVTGSGTWAYSFDGTNFTNMTAVSASSALLLLHTATLRYTPAGANGETATITYRAWDTTTGVAGSQVNLSQSSSTGGATAISTASDTASLTVTSVNDAPVLTPVNPSLGSAAPSAVKTIAITGTFINNGSGATTVTDSDTGATVGGIALVGISGAGTWEYSTDGTTWTAVGTVSASSALLLTKTASLRYTATASLSDTPTIAYRAWDTTDGAQGSKVDLSASSAVGGTTAFSTATDTATLTIAGGSLAGYVYIDTNNDGLRSTSGGYHYGLPGVPVKLLRQDTGGNWAEVSGKSPVLTGADGSFRFENLVAGTYRVQEVQPTNYLDGKETAGTVAGATKGTVGSDTIDVQLGSGEHGTEFNFGEMGLLPAKITLRMFLASTPVGADAITAVNVAPTLDLSAALAGTGYSKSVAANGTAVSIVASDATVADTDSPMLGSMTVTLTNSQDGASEILAADVSNTAITSSYAGGVLTLSGAATPADYQKVLRTISYKNTAASPHAGVRTITFTVNDGIENSLVATASITVTTSGVASYTITANDNLINSTEATNTGFTFANATVGATYNYTVTSSGGSGSVTGTGTITSATQQVTGINVSALPNGTLTYSVTLTPSGGSAGPAATATATLDKAAPTGYTVTVAESFVNASQAANVGFSFAGAEIGATYNYTVSSSGGSGNVTGTGTITSATQQISGINVSTLTDGTLTYSVTLTDPAGNAGTAATATATLDRVAPTGYSITAGDSVISGTDAANTSFTFTGAEIGALYSYTVTSSGGAGSVTNTGTITSATQQITGINVSSLPNGTLTYSVTLTDPAGNAGTAATATATLDKPAPQGYSITVDDSLISTADATNIGFTFTAAEIGTTYAYTITSSGGSGSVTGTGTIGSATEHVTGINVSSLSEGTLTFSVTLTDTANNTGTPATATATLDKTAPAGYTIQLGDNDLNAADAAHTSFTFTGAEVGASYTYTVTSDGGAGTVTATGTITSATQQITGIDVSALPNGTLTYSVTLTDPAGNVGTAATATATLDKTAPAGYSITASDNIINASEVANFGFTFAGAEIGATYTYTITSSGGAGTVTHTGAITSATEHVGGIDVASLPDGNLTISVTLTDAAGNVGTAATATASLDKAVPAGYSIVADDSVINAADATNTSFTFSGAEVGTTYAYSITSSGGLGTVNGTGTVTAADQQVTGINVASLSNGILTFLVTLTDAAGNTGTAASVTATLDKPAPLGYTITADDASINAAEATNVGFTFAGAEIGTTYTYTITSGGGAGSLTDSGLITATNQHVNGIDVSSLPDGTLTFSVTLTDASNNTGAPATATTVLDKTVPTGYTVAADDSQINAADATHTSFTFAGAEIGTTYSYWITSNGGLGQVTGVGTISAATEQITGIDVSSLPDGQLTFSVTLQDSAGNLGTAATATATLFKASPTGYSITVGDALLNATEALNTSFTFAGAEIGATYECTITSDGGSGHVMVAGTITAADQAVPNIDVSSLADGMLTFSVTLTNSAGNTGSPATATTTLDTTAPAGYSIVADDSLINATEAAAGVSFTFAGADVGANYSYTVTDGGSGSVTGTGTIASATQQITGIDVSSLADGTLTFSVTLIDAAGNAGPAATATAALDKIAPAGYSIAADDSQINAAEASNVSFTFSGAEVGATYSYTITDSDNSTVSDTGTITSANQKITTTYASFLADGTLTLTVTLTDAAGNAGTVATATTVLDKTAPSGYSITADDSLITASEATAVGFTFAGAEIGATFTYTITSNGGAGSVTGTGTISSATQQITGIDVSTLADGMLTFSVRLTDAAGNLGPAVTATATLDKTLAGAPLVDLALQQTDDWLLV
jgi:cyclophilin family peptidyl-prolyl cis-trans isomerase